MFSVKLSQIPEDGVLQEEGLKLSLEELGMGEPFLEGAVVGYELREIGGKVLGKVRAKASYAAACSRCLVDFVKELSTEFLVEFEPMPSEPNPRNVDVEDPGLNVSFFDGEEIGLGEEIRQELEIQLPFAPLCSAQCKGLCPQCGQNWNEGTCGCASRRQGGAFEALNKLFQKDQGD